MGPLHFVGESGMLECDYCGSKFAPQEIEEFYNARAAQEGDKPSTTQEPQDAQRPENEPQTVQGEQPGTSQPQQAGPAAPADPTPSGSPTPQDGPTAANEHPTWENSERENLRAYTCESCGAQLLTDDTTAVTNCPYCGNPAVLPGQLENALRPELVIPFRYTKQQAIDALKAYYKDKKFLPNGFADENHLQEIQGVYVPFWLFDAKAQGSATFDATRTTAWADSKNNYIKTDHYKATRKGSVEFSRVPVDASSKMPDAHMDAIEPFDYSDLQPFSMGYLPGYVTDRYDEDADFCRPRAEGRIEQTTTDLLGGTVVGYESVVPETCDVSPTWGNAAYALLPVWMLHTKYNGRDLLFAMNGQTGKLIGDLPVDKGKVALHFLALFVPIAVLLVALIFVFLARW